MKSYRSKNERTIQKAFARFTKDANTSIEDGVLAIAEEGLKFLIAAHNAFEENMHHVTETNTMAYVVAHNGKIVKQGYHDGKGDAFPGAAVEKAANLASTTSGWVVFILSDMENWYRYDYEVGFLLASRDQIRTNFYNYFKPIK